MTPQECTISADGEGDVMQTTMQQMDATIRQYTEEILALKIQRNKYAPISRLPVENLQKIFLIVKTLVEDETTIRGRFRRRGRLDWIRFSQVTTTWRNIALDIIDLWTEPPMWNASWAKEMVRRSKGAALTIRHDFCVRTRLGLPQFFQETLKRGENINNLRLDYISEKYVGILPTRLSRATNILLHCTNAYTCLPAEILSEASKLRVLTLESCTIDLVSCLPHSITTLKLHDVGILSTIMQFLDALANLSSLEDLHLHSAMSFDTPHSSRTINLPNLQKLSIISDMKHTIMFFRHVIVPPDMISLCVNIWGANSPDDFGLHTKDMLKAIGRVYAHDSCNMPFRTLYIGKEGGEFNFSVDDAHFLPSSCPLYLNISSWKKIPGFPTKLLTMVCRSGIPMDNINTVLLENTVRYKAKHLAQSLGRLPNISHIKSNACMALPLVKAIQMPADVRELYFSNLAILEFKGLRVKSYDIGDTRFFNKLRDCLMRRCEYDAEIDKLVLDDCSQLDNYMVKQLEQIVVDIEAKPGVAYDESIEEDDQSSDDDTDDEYV